MLSDTRISVDIGRYILHRFRGHAQGQVNQYFGQICHSQHRGHAQGQVNQHFGLNSFALRRAMHNIGVMHRGR